MTTRFLVAFAVLMAGGVALADRPLQQVRLTGVQPSAFVEAYLPQGNVWAYLYAGTNAANEEVVFAHWLGVSSSFDDTEEPGRYQSWVEVCSGDGEFPLSSVRVEGAKRMIFALDTSSQPLTAWGSCQVTTCSYVDWVGDCTETATPGAAWSGTFTRVDVPTFTEEADGKRTETVVFECEFGTCVGITKTTGSFTKAPAKFEGTIGRVTLETSLEGAWWLQAGQGTYTLYARGP